MEKGGVGVRGSYHSSLFCSQLAPNLFLPQGLHICLPPSHPISWVDGTHYTPPPGHEPPPPNPCLVLCLTSKDTQAWWQSKTGFSTMNSTAGSACCTGCRRAHLLKPAVTLKITHRDLRGVLESPPLLQDQPLVIDSYNKKPTSCKHFGVLRSLGHSSGLINISLSHCLASLFVHEIIYCFCKKFFCLFVCFPQWSKPSLCSTSLTHFNSGFIFPHCYFFSARKVSIAPTLVFCRQLEGSIYFGFLLLIQVNNISPQKYTEREDSKNLVSK